MATINVQRRICTKNSNKGKAAFASKIKNFGERAESRQCASGGGLFILKLYHKHL